MIAHEAALASRESFKKQCEELNDGIIERNNQIADLTARVEMLHNKHNDLQVAHEKALASKGSAKERCKHLEFDIVELEAARDVKEESFKKQCKEYNDGIIERNNQIAALELALTELKLSHKKQRDDDGIVEENEPISIRSAITNLLKQLAAIMVNLQRQLECSRKENELLLTQACGDETLIHEHKKAVATIADLEAKLELSHEKNDKLTDDYDLRGRIIISLTDDKESVNRIRFELAQECKEKDAIIADLKAKLELSREESAATIDDLKAKSEHVDGNANELDIEWTHICDEKDDIIADLIHKLELAKANALPTYEHAERASLEAEEDKLVQECKKKDATIADLLATITDLKANISDKKYIMNESIRILRRN